MYDCCMHTLWITVLEMKNVERQVRVQGYRNENYTSGRLDRPLDRAQGYIKKVERQVFSVQGYRIPGKRSSLNLQI